MIKDVGGEETVALNAYADFARIFREQLEKGEKKYGTVLKTFNQRDPGEDAFQELVDLSQYVEQLRMERQALAEILYVLWCTVPECDLPKKVEDMLCKLDNPNSVTLARKWGMK